MGWVGVVNMSEISIKPNPLNKWVRRVDSFILNGLKISTQPAIIGLDWQVGSVFTSPTLKPFEVSHRRKLRYRNPTRYMGRGVAHYETFKEVA